MGDVAKVGKIQLHPGAKNAGQGGQGRQGREKVLHMNATWYDILSASFM